MESVLNATAIKVVGTALTFLLSWRVWRFTIRPRLHPDEPKELPYWIPFIGHAAGFFMDFNGAIEKGRKHFQPSREPFTMTVAGQTMYVATSAEDIGAVWKNTKTISMNPLTMDMYVWSGLSEKSRRAMFDPHPSARYNAGNGRPFTPTQMVIELHHQQLSPGPRLDALVDRKILPSLFKQLDFSKSAHPAVVSRSKNSVVVSLLDLCVDLFITEDTEAYFGTALLRSSPDLIKAFMDWEYSSWKFLFQLPDAFSKDMLEAKNTITGAFTSYYKLPRSERSGSVFFIDALEDMLREVGLNENEMGKFTLLHYWAIVGNVYKMAFWLVSHLAHAPALLKQIQQEVYPAVTENSLNEQYLVENCPKLDSLIGETLRLTVASSLARVILEPTSVGGKVLKPGNKIMLPISELHYDPVVWGPSPNKLRPDRFIENGKLSKSLSYRPWGGGHTLCPGRFLARRSLNAFIAILLSRYDIAPQSTSFPKGDTARPSAGVIPVALGEDLKLQLTPRT